MCHYQLHGLALPQILIAAVALATPAFMTTSPFNLGAVSAHEAFDHFSDCAHIHYTCTHK